MSGTSWRTSAWWVASMALGACGGSSEPSGESGSQAATSGSGASGAGGSSANASASGSTGGGGDMCGVGSIDMNDPCEVCVATSCTMQALACCQQPGCLDIVRCAQEKGCSGIDCYAPETCKDVIDKAGGPAVATMYAKPLGDCALASCKDKCGGGGGAGGSGGGS